MENIVWLCTFGENTVVIEPQLSRYLCAGECQMCANEEVRMKEGIKSERWTPKRVSTSQREWKDWSQGQLKGLSNAVKRLTGGYRGHGKESNVPRRKFCLSY